MFLESGSLYMKNEFSNNSKNTAKERVSGRFTVGDMKQTVAVGFTMVLTPKQAAAVLQRKRLEK